MIVYDSIEVILSIALVIVEVKEGNSRKESESL